MHSPWTIPRAVNERQQLAPPDANPIPPFKSWFGWMKLCSDADRDCLIGMVGEKFYAFRYVPAA